MRRRKKYAYNPNKSPKPDEWLALEEQEQIDLVEEYHIRKKIELPNAKVHASIHAIIETQAALGDEVPIKEALQRLQAEDLNRHDAIHAIGSVLSTHFWTISRGDERDDKSAEAYYEAVRQLTKDKWYEEYG